MGQNTSLIETELNYGERSSGCGAATTIAPGSKSQTIANLIEVARANHFEDNPTEALAALLQAIQLNAGQEEADRVMETLRNELGTDLASDIDTRQERMERAIQIVQELVADDSTLLYQQDRQDILRHAMEDGSSVVCTKCNAVVANHRWQQHAKYWCEAISVESG